ncbi:DUF6708 domain-containing protein [Chromohalobacter nigrandesensis]|uniref:DUF6708 domain-containing protein n=1 Tax=Chromohalobacter nigrandesensis TaxID=119863 RepID=UPI001FF46ABB|nr:DUF6708 domain-containing protein [Chromohalobacter nigrandesensis]MCK0746732.1 hypothetical protein [Chromohalobacter nigrandesensis]
MNFTGLGPYKWKYRVNHKLSDEDKLGYLDKKKRFSEEPSDDLSVIRINSTYMELVDRWYSSKGHAVVYGIIGLTPFIFGILMAASVLPELRKDAFIVGLVGIFVMLAVCLAFFYLVCFEAFRKTHYPIRLNRKNRMVYAFKADGNIITASWDDLFIHKASSKPPLSEKDYDIRAHVLDADGETVRETFTLAMPHSGAEERLLDLWEYIRRYMEDENGVKKNHMLTQFCWPIGERREGLRYSIIGGFSPAAIAPYLVQLPFCPYFALITWGRLIAMYTSRVPRWPEGIEAECRIPDNDPYQKDWRDNSKLSFERDTVPVIGFVIGSIILVAAITWTVTSIIDAM